MNGSTLDNNITCTGDIQNIETIDNKEFIISFVSPVTTWTTITLTSNITDTSGNELVTVMENLIEIIYNGTSWEISN